MKKGTIFIILLLLTIEVLATLSERSDPTRNNGARLDWTSCWFTVPHSQSVHCAYFYPSDNQTAKKSQPIRLPVVIIHPQATTGTHPVSPILYLNGGPGVATGLDQEGMKNWWTWVEENEWPSDVVLFDQRGTGLSTPTLQCPEIRTIQRKSLDKPLSAHEEFKVWRQAVKRCYQRLRQTGVDLSKYSTTQSSRDVSELIEALGGSHWNLYGVSYGTRLALSVVRDYPQKIRSVVLDSVYPPEINDLLEFPFIYDNALTTLFKSCHADKVCRSTFPNLESSLFALLEQLRQAPITLTVPNATAVGHLQAVVINDERFMEIVFYALYSSDISQTLPRTIAAARQGQYEQLKPLVENYVDWLLDKGFSHGVYWSVECYDRSPHTTREDFLAKVGQFPRIKKFVEKQWDYDLCRFWKDDHADETFRTPVASDIPTLFLAGEYDPVTPPLWARKAASHFKRGYFFTLPGIGHGVVNSDTCGSEVVRDFLRSPFLKPQNECIYWPRDSSLVLDKHDGETVAADGL